MKVLLPEGASQVDTFRSFGSCIADGDSLTIIVTPERLGEIMEVAVRLKLLVDRRPGHARGGVLARRREVDR